MLGVRDWTDRSAWLVLQTSSYTLSCVVRAALAAASSECHSAGTAYTFRAAAECVAFAVGARRRGTASSPTRSTGRRPTILVGSVARNHSLKLACQSPFVERSRSPTPALPDTALDPAASRATRAVRGAKSAVDLGFRSGSCRVEARHGARVSSVPPF